MVIKRNYEIEFVQSLIETALLGLGFTKTEIITEIGETETDPDTGTDLRHIRVETDFISFEMHEVLRYWGVSSKDMTVCYQPAFFRGVPGTGENPPDLDVIEGDAQGSPTVAICKAIQFCVEEVVNGRCNDQMMYRDWLEEQKDQHGNEGN